MDRSTRTPLGVVENILVKVGKFFLPVDFYVLDMADALDHPIIIGRSFLAIGGVIIDVKKGTLSFNFGKEMEEFHVVNKVHSLMVEEKAPNVNFLETFCLLSTSLPLKILNETRVEVATRVNKGKQQRDMEYDLSFSWHEENKKKGVSIEEDQSRRNKAEFLVMAGVRQVHLSFVISGPEYRVSYPTEIKSISTYRFPII